MGKLKSSNMVHAGKINVADAGIPYSDLLYELNC